MTTNDAPRLYSSFERFELPLTLEQARAASHPGKCDADVAALRTEPEVARQLAALDPDKVRAELKEYGAWEPEELADHDANLSRVVWIAAGNIAEDAARGNDG